MSPAVNAQCCGRAAIPICPGLEEKIDSVPNAIDLAHVLGVALPKVVIMSTIEMVNPKIISALDAAALCKMADRGQITGAILDGPLAFDRPGEDQPSLRDYSFCYSPPRISSWAKFSRPFGTGSVFSRIGVINGENRLWFPARQGAFV